MKYTAEIIVVILLAIFAITVVNWQPPSPRMVLPAWDK